MALILSCTRVSYVPVESSTYDSIRQSISENSERIRAIAESAILQTSRYDSVVIHDSVVLVVNQSGDVVSREVFHQKERDSNTEQMIAYIQNRYDSIINAQQEKYEALIKKNTQTPVVVERELSKWEKLKQDIGGVALGLVLAVLAVAITWLAKKIRFKS